MQFFLKNIRLILLDNPILQLVNVKYRVLIGYLKILIGYLEMKCFQQLSQNTELSLVSQITGFSLYTNSNRVLIGYQELQSSQRLSPSICSHWLFGNAEISLVFRKCRDLIGYQEFQSFYWLLRIPEFSFVIKNYRAPIGYQELRVFIGNQKILLSGNREFLLVIIDCRAVIG